MDFGVAVADFHCGSAYGLLPPKYWSEVSNPAVKWLWKRVWLPLLKKLPKKFDLLILDGDLIDGKQYRARATTLVTADLGEQTKIAIDCIEPLADRAKKIVRLEGTAYHECHDGPLNALDEHFDIKKPENHTNRIVRDIQLSDEAILNVKHKPEGEGCLYRGTSLDREVLWATLTETCKKIPKATHILRAHLHSDGYLKGFGKVIVQMPGLCLQQPHALQKRYYRFHPDLGLVVIQKTRYAHKGFSIDSLTIPLPERKAERYEEL